MNTAELITETLAAHHAWDVRIMQGLMVCKGCDWSRKPVRGESNTDAFRQHQADMVAAALPEQPGPTDFAGAPREDLTVFAALVARLGGDVTITWEEAARLQGVTVTRWDEPEHMRYRFTIAPAETPDTPAGLAGRALPPQQAIEAPADADLHSRRAHPGYEYDTTAGQRKNWNDADTPPEGEGWERNADAGRDGWDRFDFHEESYWRRPRPGFAALAHQCESWQIRRNDAGDRYCAACGAQQ